MIKLYGRHTSYNVQKVLWLLEELELAYDHIQTGGKYGGTESPEFKKLNPFRKVPVLVDSDKNLWESNTILRYLADTYGTDDWKVTTSYNRSKYERWMDWSIDRFEPAFVGVFWGRYRTPPERRNIAEINNHLKSCQYCVTILDEVLDNNKYLAGENLSLADISVGVFMYRLLNIGLDIHLTKNTDRWYKLLMNSNGYKIWVMSDFTELAGRENY